MTPVYLKSKNSLPTNTLDDKYFYLINSDYYSHSDYIYFYLEDNNYSLNYSSIKYCHTNTNPNSHTTDAVNKCSFDSVSLYATQKYLDIAKYYYKFSTSSKYYAIVYYDRK